MRHAVGVLLLLVSATSARGQDGASLYAQHCGSCHDLGLPRTPTRRVLSGLEPDRILAALETGTMHPGRATNRRRASRDRSLPDGQVCRRHACAAVPEDVRRQAVRHVGDAMERVGRHTRE